MGATGYAQFGDDAPVTFEVSRLEGGQVEPADAELELPASASHVAIRAGDQVVVHHAPERLAQCATSQGGYPGWSITLHWQIDGGTVHDVSASRASGGDLVPGDPAITIPRGGDLALWFEATSTYGCDAFDSALGANYHISIE